MHATLPMPNPTRRRLLQASGATLLVTGLPGCSSDEDLAARFHTSTAWGRERIAEHMRREPNAAAVTIALLYEDTVVWQEAFGMASVEDARAATVDTRFNIGSVSKVVAALTGVILQDQGLLDLDRPIAQYLPAFSMLSPDYTKITSRHLLSHTSGLPGTNRRNIFSFAPIAGYAEDTEAGLAHYHLKHTPGAMAVYCNDGFTLFERVVQAVSGLSYPEFVSRHIFEPLGMSHSSFLLEPPTQGDYALPYLAGRQYGLEYSQPYASGGVSSTPGDMMKLAQMFIGAGVFEGRRIVSAAGIAEMGTAQTLNTTIHPEPRWQWGLGWDTVQHPNMDAVGALAWQKNGGTIFFQTEFFVLPEARMALLVSGNSGYDPLTIAEGVLSRALQDAAVIRTLPPPVEAAMPAPLVPPADLAAYAGIYGNYDAPLKVEILPAGQLMLHRWSEDGWQAIEDGRAGPFTLRNDGWWWAADGKLPTYRFQLLDTFENSTPLRLRYLIKRYLQGGRYRYITVPLGQRLEPRAPLSTAWRARLGTSWRMTNDDPESILQHLFGDELSTLSELPELPGYVLFENAQLLIPQTDERAIMAVKVPVNFGRDLSEIVFPPDTGGRVLRIGTGLYERV